MLIKFIYLQDISAAVTFANAVSKYSYKSELVSDDIIIDAKSILSVIGLAIGRNMKLCIDAKEADDMLKEISQFQR